MSSHPRISFSNDFVDSNLLSQHHIKPRPEPEHDPEASNFEFSISNYSMMSADELFSQGKLLPFKESGRKMTTLREELLARDEEEEEEEERGSGYSGRPPKASGSGRWKEILGLKRANLRKSDRPEPRRMSFGHDPDAHSSKSSQERSNDGGSSRRDGGYIYRM